MFDFFIVETVLVDANTELTGKKTYKIDSVWLTKECATSFVKQEKAKQKELPQWKRTQYSVKALKEKRIRNVKVNNSIKVSVLNSNNKVEIITVLAFENDSRTVIDFKKQYVSPIIQDSFDDCLIEIPA